MDKQSLQQQLVQLKKELKIVQNKIDKIQKTFANIENNIQTSTEVVIFSYVNYYLF